MPSVTAVALGLVGDMELLRLKAIARLQARALPPDVGWEDLLQEAFTRVITGARVQPPGVPIVAFLAGVMRSLKSEYWRRALRRHSADEPLHVDPTGTDPLAVDLPDESPSLERALSARQELAAIQGLFAEDPIAAAIIAGLSRGLAAEEIRRNAAMSETAYDSARKRIRRRLLKEGFTCEPR